MKENLLIDKSIAFAARIVKLHQHLIKNKKETAETEYRIKLLYMSEYIDDKMHSSLPAIVLILSEY